MAGYHQILDTALRPPGLQAGQDTMKKGCGLWAICFMCKSSRSSQRMQFTTIVARLTTQSCSFHSLIEYWLPIEKARCLTENVPSVVKVVRINLSGPLLPPTGEHRASLAVVYCIEHPPIYRLIKRLH